MFFLKGATAFEFQLGRRYMRIVHLAGPSWPWYAPWRRLSLHKQ